MNDHLIYLAQTDTTAGFLSKDAEYINRTKNRWKKTPLIMTFGSLLALKDKVRIPQRFKKEVRRASKTTYILPSSLSFRVAHEPNHKAFLNRFDYMFSSSANPHKEPFDTKFALKRADVVVLDHRGIFDAKPSTILKINSKKKRKKR